MAGFKKRHEKAQEMRTEIQKKAKMTREELKGALLRNVREEQLDAVPGEALTTKNRLSRLSSVGAAKALEVGFIKTEDVAGKFPPRWNRLLSAEFTVEDWNTVMAGVDETPMEPAEPKTLRLINEKKLIQRFKGRCYDDEDMMKLIMEAYMVGVEDANVRMNSSDVVSPLATNRRLAQAQQRIIEFLITDHGEKVNPILHLTPRELVDRVTLYFVECDLTKRFYTVPGLAFYIGFSTREEFHEYVSQNPESVHAYILRRAMTYIESETVTDMMYGGGMMTGHKINLATNFNYSDAGKKSDAKDAPAITINNNSITMNGVPPKPETIEEWQAWYAKEQAAKSLGNGASSTQPVIDVDVVSGS
jgi:hypothetical protein